ncbi:MAG: hypothetical protein K8I82_15340 [Anaerolineae bacterium]|nr:hypothetical protein [Anaerolineae bacterium]
MSEKPLKTLPCLEKTLDLYADRIVLHNKRSLLRHAESVQKVIFLRDIAHLIHLEEPAFRAGYYNLLIKQADGKILVLSYAQKHQHTAQQICKHVLNAVVAA